MPRTVRKIKNELIHKAKIKKQYSKIRERELKDQPSNHPSLYADADADADADASSLPSKEQGAALPQSAASQELHPDRQRMIDAPDTQPEQRPRQKGGRQKAARRPDPFAKESAEAERRREEAERWRRERQEAEEKKQRRLAERARERKAMMKANGVGSGGGRKLGRESAVLLGRVKKLMAE